MPHYAICPFYMYEKGTTLGCELKKMDFPTAADKNIWAENLCCTFDYKYCSNAQLLLKSYEQIYRE